MIPKVIHYCWFGGAEFPSLVKKCMDSWKKYCPDWDIIEWNESNFDVNICDYVKEAYKVKKWAFVSDYARLWVLINYGGIYLDTDCELVKSIDCFLDHNAVSGFERKASVPTALMGSIKGFEFFKLLLDRYDGRHFILSDGSLDMTPNVSDITRACVERGLVLNGQKQTIYDFVLYPHEYFCPMASTDRNLDAFSENTYAIHHFNGSWLSSERDIYIYGSGVYGQIWYKYHAAVHNAFNVKGFLDSNPEKQGTNVLGIPVYSPEKLREVDFSRVIVANKNINNVNEMFNTLHNLGLNILDKALRFSQVDFETHMGSTYDLRYLFAEDFSKIVCDIEGAIAECGVFEGTFAKFLNMFYPNRKMYLFDTFSGFDQRDIDIYENNHSDFIAGHHSDMTRFRRSNLKEKVINKMRYSNDVIIKEGWIPESFEGVDDKFVFVSVDTDLYNPTKESLLFFSVRMQSNGCILVHDYYTRSLPGVKKAFDEFYELYGSNFIKCGVGDGCSIAIIKS